MQTLGRYIVYCNILNYSNLSVYNATGFYVYIQYKFWKTSEVDDVWFRCSQQHEYDIHGVLFLKINYVNSFGIKLTRSEWTFIISFYGKS